MSEFALRLTRAGEVLFQGRVYVKTKKGYVWLDEDGKVIFRMESDGRTLNLELQDVREGDRDE